MCANVRFQPYRLHSLAPGAVSGFQFLVSGFWFLETRSSSWLLVSGSRPGLYWLKGLDEPVQKAAHFPRAVKQLCDRFGDSESPGFPLSESGFPARSASLELARETAETLLSTICLALGDVTGNGYS